MAKKQKAVQGAAPVTGAVVTINPQAKVAFRPGSARAAYYAVLAAHNGQPVSAFIAAVAAQPPSVPARGKLAGKPEPVQGWLSWFVRHGYCTIA